MTNSFVVLRLNATGGLVWQNAFGVGLNNAFAASAQQTSDGGFIVVGGTTSFGAGSDVWVLKLNATGGVVWQKTYGGAGDDFATSVQQTSDGAFIVAGNTNSFGAGGYDVWVLKLDPTGGVVWQKTYGGTGNDFADSVRQTTDGGYIVGGRTSSFGQGLIDAWVLKLNATGGVVWQKTYGGKGDDFASSAQQTSDGGYIVAGGTNSFGQGATDAWVLKLDATGGVVWQKTYGGTDVDFGNSIEQTSDGGFVVAGSTRSFGPGGGHSIGWVLKLDANGNIGSNCSLIRASSAMAKEADGKVTITTITGIATSATVTMTSATANRSFGLTVVLC